MVRTGARPATIPPGKRSANSGRWRAGRRHLRRHQHRCRRLHVFSLFWAYVQPRRHPARPVRSSWPCTRSSRPGLLSLPADIRSTTSSVCCKRFCSSALPLAVALGREAALVTTISWIALAVLVAAMVSNIAPAFSPGALPLDPFMAYSNERSSSAGTDGARRFGWASLQSLLACCPPPPGHVERQLPGGAAPRACPQIDHACVSFVAGRAESRPEFTASTGLFQRNRPKADSSGGRREVPHPARNTRPDGRPSIKSLDSYIS